MSFLNELSIESQSAGTCMGHGAWSAEGERWIESMNPTTGDLIGRVRVTTHAEYDQLMVAAQATAREWARIPAPKRGEAVRLIGEAL